ncbi:MAG TPA: sigma-70 family RNA polymerase sigma factor, partial [Gemmataceae bacterium]|nr:sigma-70 family RNA polymerase sigma factor [Gemmataceae bacterium]
MARHAGGAMLQAVQSAAAAEMTDRDLLARFTEGDETAFAALVNRHGGMVLGVCRRMLPTVQDAEDACQATFLVLAKKAGSGQWQASVANWLYMTARRIASRANRAASRRARRESRSIPPVTTSTLDQMTGREAFATLDEELDRLPAIYREPLVLCYLEGLTRDEAAARLRVPPATLKSQLDRGRKRLGRALTRRGVSLGAGLLAVSATSRAGAVPARIGHSILASTRGTVPRSVAELCRGVAMNGTGTKALLLALALIGAAVLGVGAVSPMAGEQKPDRPIVKKADADGKQPTAKPEPPPARTYAGRVIGPDGKPMKGAAVFAFESAGPSDSTKARDRETVRTVADAQGKFRIRLPAGKTFMPSLFATAEGFGIGRVEVERDGATDDVSIQLIADNEITGRVTTTEGKPVAGARIKVERIVDDVTDLDELLYRFKFAERRDPIRERRSMPVWFAELGTTAVTDKDGAFRLNGGGRDRVLYVEVDADGFSSDRLIVVNRPKFDPKPFNDGAAKNAAAMPVRRALKSERLHGPSLDLIVEREKPIQGVVKDAETGKPRTGVKVHLWMPEQPRLRLNAVTDAKGQFQLRGVRKAASYTLVLD